MIGTASDRLTRAIRRRATARMVVAFAFSLSLLSTDVTAQKPYSDAVVTKAETILQEADLRRSGKVIQMTGNSSISRALSGLTKEKRELRLLRQDWQKVVDQLAAVRKELERLNTQYGEMNLQLARVANNPTASTQLVGLINATTAKMKALATQRERLKDTVTEKRSALNEAEVKYADTVLAIRDDFTATREKLAESLRDEQVQIALSVMHRNFETPESVTADSILASLDKRIERIEEEIFRETIPMQVKGGTMYVDVVVGTQTTPMVVDSGATMISLPMKTATELGIEVPPEAQELKLVLADGRTIPARAVTLPRVRVGRFEVENVDAAVLDAVADDAEPLLGMSFLGNFKFEVDAGEKSLKFLSVGEE